MHIFKYIKKVYKIIPADYKSKSAPFVIFSFINLLLELFSFALAIPLILMIFDSTSYSSNPFFAGLIGYLPDETRHLTTIAALLIILIFIAKNIISIKITRYQATTGFNLASDISLQLTRNYLLNDFMRFKEQEKADLVRNSIEIPNNFTAHILLALNIMLSELLLLCFICVIGLWISPLITLLLCFIFGLAVFISQGISKHAFIDINRHFPGNYSKNMANLFNLINGFFEIKTAGQEDFFLKHFATSNRELNNKYAQLYAKNFITPKYNEVIIIVLVGFMIMFYNIFGLHDNDPLLYISFLAAAAMKVIPSVNKIFISFINFRAHLFTIDIIEENLNSGPSVLLQKTSAVAFKKEIRLQHIWFSYDDKPLLSDVDITILKGQVVFITGNSGTGKSTLLYILAQLLNPQKGLIKIDGQSLAQDQKTSFLNLLAFVPQSPFIMQGSILDNITLGNPDNINKVFMEKLLKDFELLETINKLPGGLNTYIGIDGHHLSGGQKQRIALVRALIQQPQLLILDEATNQLEKELEQKILLKLRDLAGEKNITIIIVAHNISNIISFSDKVFSLKDGKIHQKD